METGSAFIVGLNHAKVATPCQDYARHGLNWIAVSDGCSTGRYTDIGARFLLLGVEELMNFYGPQKLEDIVDFQNTLRKQVSTKLGSLNILDTLATTVVAGVHEDNVFVNIAGDGVFAIETPDNTLEYWELSVPSNAPLYPVYFYNNEMLDNWLKLTNCQDLNVKHYIYDMNGELIKLNTHVLNFKEQGLNLKLDIKNINKMLVCTDGLFTIPNVRPFDTLASLFDVQNLTGDFLNRRLGALNRNWMKNYNTGPADDFGVSGAWLWTQ